MSLCVCATSRVLQGVKLSQIDGRASLDERQKGGKGGVGCCVAVPRDGEDETERGQGKGVRVERVSQRLVRLEYGVRRVC